MTPQEAGRLGGITTRPIIKRLAEEFRIKYYENPKLCEGCLTIIPFDKRKNRYCSRSCAASHNQETKKPSKIRKDKVDHFCLNCNKITKNRKYCSFTCMQEYKRMKQLEEGTISSN